MKQCFEFACAIAATTVSGAGIFTAEPLQQTALFNFHKPFVQFGMNLKVFGGFGWFKMIFWIV